MDAGSEVHVMSLKVVRRELLSVFGLKNRMIEQYYQHVEGGTRKAPLMRFAPYMESTDTKLATLYDEQVPLNVSMTPTYSYSVEFIEPSDRVTICTWRM